MQLYKHEIKVAVYVLNQPNYICFIFPFFGKDAL